MHRAIAAFMQNSYSALGDEHMMPRDGIICLSLSFEFIDHFLGDTDPDLFEIHPFSKAKLQRSSDILNGSDKNNHTSLKSASTHSMAPFRSVVASDAAQCHYRYPLLMVLWNVRSLFAYGLEDTWNYALKLMKCHNIGVLTETRSTVERIKVLRTHLPSSLM